MVSHGTTPDNAYKSLLVYIKQLDWFITRLVNIGNSENALRKFQMGFKKIFGVSFSKFPC